MVLTNSLQNEQIKMFVSITKNVVIKNSIYFENFYQKSKMLPLSLVRQAKGSLV